MGQYVSVLRPDARRGRSFVSRRGTQQARDGFLQCSSVSNVPVES